TKCWRGGFRRALWIGLDHSYNARPPQCVVYHSDITLFEDIERQFAARQEPNSGERKNPKHPPQIIPAPKEMVDAHFAVLTRLTRPCPARLRARKAAGHHSSFES